MAYWLAVGAAFAGVGIMVARRYFAGGVCRSLAMMTGKSVIITGANSGIGKAAATELAKREARVIMACRDLDSGEQAIKDIRRKTRNGELVLKHLDLASFQSIHKFSEDILKEEQRLDVLINNAGIFQCPFMKTEDGYEMQFGVNHLGHFLLTNLLLGLLKKSKPSRIVVVSSKLHSRGNIDFENLNMTEANYNRAAGYSNSKLANILFARELAHRLDNTGVTVNCLHPGIVWTNLSRHMNVSPVVKILMRPLIWLLLKSPEEGAQTVVYLSVAPELEDQSGKYFGDCHEKPFTAIARDDGVAKKLWEASEKMTGLA
ncbi:retinol dehydrogenase 14-like [Ptychodera flava]|uniref:retinol dehydrogenase 14-like n=1 Tax=Ptychodera flava TaxID=63121 RepID=UPI003969E5A5